MPTESIEMLSAIRDTGSNVVYWLGPSLLKNSVFHFRRLLAFFGQNNNEEQCPEAEDGKSPRYFSRG